MSAVKRRGISPPPPLEKAMMSLQLPEKINLTTLMTTDYHLPPIVIWLCLGSSPSSATQWITTGRISLPTPSSPSPSYRPG